MNNFFVNTEKLKFGLLTELKACTYRIGQLLKKKYKREMDYVYAVMSEMERKLDRQIRDLDDVRLVMDTLKKIREQEVDMELRIEPIEVKYGFVFFYKFTNFVNQKITTYAKLNQYEYNVIKLNLKI